MSNYCIDCGKEIHPKSKRCRSCATKVSMTKRDTKGENNPFFGKHHSEETKKKIGESERGKIMSEEARIKISESLKGHDVSEETRNKISEANKGHIHSEETRRKISDAVRDENFDLNHKFFKGQSYLLNQGRWIRTNIPPTIFLYQDVWNHYHPEDQIVIGDGYVIHHINGDQSDDRIENLKKMTNSEHSSFHSEQRRNKRKDE